MSRFFAFSTPTRLGLTLFSVVSCISVNYSLAEDARVLPAGRHRLSVVIGQASGISKTYNENGEEKKITDPYNLSLDSAALASFDPELSNLVNLLNATGIRYDSNLTGTQTHGITTDPSKPLLGDALSKGFLGVDAEAKRTQYVLQFQRGVTDRLSMGFVIPVIQTTVNTRHAIEQTNATIQDALYAMQGLGNTPQASAIVSGLSQLNAANTETLQDVLQSKGYKRFGDYSGSGIGDVVFGGRYNYLKTRREDWLASAQFSITAPTGSTRSADSLTEVDNGQGTWDFSPGHITNWNPTIGKNTALTFSHSLYYRHRLPGTREMRVRENPDDFIPDASSTEKVDMQLGDKLWTILGAKYKFASWLSMDIGYEWYWKGEDRYMGSRAKDYTYLSEETELYLETANIGLSISTIDAFLKYKFPLPLDFALGYYMPVRGKNSVIAPFASAELALYF